MPLATQRRSAKIKSPRKTIHTRLENELELKMNRAQTETSSPNGGGLHQLPNVVADRWLVGRR